MTTRKKKGGIMTPAGGGDDTVESLKKDLESEAKAKDQVEWSNVELERSVRAMEANVLQLEAGNHEADDSETRLRYENQRQLNVQLQEQKRWLEHELEQIKLKIQNEKLHPLPDPFALDWDNLSETELKRLVIQLEKTRADLKSDLKEAQLRLDKEGREYHHADAFVRMYQAEVKNLDRILETLARAGAVPTGLQLPSTGSSAAGSNQTTGGVPTPGGGSGGVGGFPVRKPSSLSPPLTRRIVHKAPSPTQTSPRKTPGSPRKTPGSPKKTLAKTPTSPKKALPQPTSPKKAPPPRRGAKQLPKIEKKDNRDNKTAALEARKQAAMAELDTVDEEN